MKIWKGSNPANSDTSAAKEGPMDGFDGPDSHGRMTVARRTTVSEIEKLLVVMGFIVSLLTIPVLAFTSVAHASVTFPECSDLQKWLATVDSKKRWNPVEGSRAWLPAAFQDPAFLETFGASPLQWTQAEAVEASKRLFQCGTRAGEAGDRRTRTAFYSARGWFQGNLVGVLAAHSRAVAKEKQMALQAARKEKARKQQQARLAAEQKQQQNQQQAKADRMQALQAALDEVVNQPDSLELLQSLVVLRETNPRDALGVNRAIARFGPKAGSLLGHARQMNLTMRDAPIGPAIENRIGELRKAIVEDYTKRIDALTAGEPGALKFLNRWDSEVRQQYAELLGPEMTSSLQTRIADRRTVIEDNILTAQMKRIDGAVELPKAADGLARIQESINRGHQAGLSPERLARLRAHAADVEAGLAEQAIVEAKASLASVSEDLDGVRFLLNTVPRADRPPLSNAPQGVLDSYRQAARNRLDEVAGAALPEFKDSLQSFPESQQGIHLLERTMVSDKAFTLVSPGIRKEYQSAVNERREEIRHTLRQATEKERQGSIARGGDVALIGQVFENKETGLAVGFIDEKRAVVGLNGKEDIVPYEVRDNQIFVHGRGMTLQLNRSGTGANTELEWLGKILKRYQR